MTIQLTGGQRLALKEQFDADAASIATNPTASYQASYALLYKDIEGANSDSDSATGSLDPKSLYWYQQAVTINGNIPTNQANIFIRAVTATGLQWDGLLRTDRDVQLQAISNKIAEAVIGSIVNTDPNSSGVVEGTDVTVPDDVSGALKDNANGPVTIGGWGGAFYYWDNKYPALDGSEQTVAQSIQGDATHKAEEQKFIAASATAAVAAVFNATSDPSVSSAGHLLTQWINNAFQGYYLLGSAPVPQYYKDEIRNRAIDVSFRRTAAGSPDEIKLSTGTNYFYLSSSKIWYYRDLSKAVSAPDGPLYLDRQADQNTVQTLDIIQALRKGHQGFDSPTTKDHASIDYDEQDGSYIKTAEGDQGGYKIQGYDSSDQLSTQTTVLADDQTYKAGTDSSLQKETIVALGTGDTIETNDQNAPTIQIGGFSETASNGQSGSSLVLMPKTNSPYLTQVVFGDGAGNSVTRIGNVSQPDLDVQVFPGAAYPRSPLDQLHLHIVFAGLNEADLDFYYKTIYDKDPVHYDFHTRELGYVQIKATGETLVLPQGGIYAAYLADGTLTGDYKLPSDFTFTFADGTTVSGTALSALFNQEGAAEHLEYSSIGSGDGYTSYKTITGDIQNAPSAYLAAEQNGGGPAAPAASTGTATVTDTGSNVVFGYGQGDGTLEITPNYRSIVQFASSIVRSSVAASGDSQGNMTLTDGANGDQVVLDGMLTDPSRAVQSVSFADGTTLTAAQALGLLNTTGTAGSDTLYGSYLSEVFDGQGAPSGAKDLAVGNGGGDAFIFNQGYGALEVNEQDNGSNPTNVLRLGAGITASDVTASEDAGGDITLQLSANGDQITLDGMAASAARGVQSVVFADGTTWNAAQVFSLLGPHTIGTAGSDTLYGTWGADVFDGKGAPSGTKDLEIGYGGGDTFIFNQGYGALEINEQDPSPSPMNVLKFGAGITASSVAVTSNANGDVILTLGTSGDQVTLDGMSRGSSFFGPRSVFGVQSVSFSDGTVWSADRIRSFLKPHITGTSGADSLSGTSAGEYIDGKGAPAGSQDYEKGGGGSDTFIYNQGYGQLEVDETDYYSYKPNNVLQLGAGITASQLTATSDSSGNVYLADGTAGDRIKLDGELSGLYQGVQSVQFDDGTVLTRQQIAVLAMTGTTGADNLYGSTGADTFDGKGASAGSQDYEHGGGGNDTFIYNQGYGQLEVDETDYQSSDTNVLRLGAGIAAAQLAVTSDDAGNIYLADGTAGDRIKLDGELNGSSYGVQSVQFADGTSWTPAQLFQKAAVGTTGADRLHGPSAAQVFDGNGAPAGSQDYEHGGGGGDTFVYDAGYGQLEINEVAQGSGTNTLQIGPGVTAAQITVTGDSSGNLFLSDGTAGDRIKLDGELNGTQYGVQSVRFADGSALTAAQLAQAADTGTAGADTLYGTPGADTFDGKGAPAGSQDYEQGRGGNDTFVFGPGYGQLEVSEADGALSPHNTLQFGPGILPSQVSLNGDYDDWNLNVTVGTGGDMVVLDDQLLSSRYGVQRMSFADGTTWDRTEIVRQTGLGMPGKPVLYGSRGDDVFDPRGQAHEIWGWGGSDTYMMDRGYGGVTIHNSSYSSSPHGYLAFSEAVASDQLWFARSGNNLVATILGTTDQATVKSWFTNSGAPTADIEAAGGARLDAGLGQLVSSMASYQAANPGFNSAIASAMPDDPSLRSALAAAWHS